MQTLDDHQLGPRQLGAVNLLRPRTTACPAVKKEAGQNTAPALVKTQGQKEFMSPLWIGKPISTSARTQFSNWGSPRWHEKKTWASSGCVVL